MTGVQTCALPISSHPNRYWNKNASKFLSLWRARQDFNATLYLVNYAEENTKFEDQVLLIEVIDMDENGITSEHQTKHTMKSFSKWFITVNNRCLKSKEDLAYEIYNNKSIDELGKITLRKGKHQRETIEKIYNTDFGYLEWHSCSNYEYSKAVMCYLQKRKHINEQDKGI